MKRLSIYTVLIVLVVAACAAGGLTYTSANESYRVNADAYTQARLVIVDGSGVRRPGVTSDEQWSRFRAAENDVIAADAIVYADLQQWERTSVRPVMYQTHADALTDAQQRIVQLSREVRP